MTILITQFFSGKGIIFSEVAASAFRPEQSALWPLLLGDDQGSNVHGLNKFEVERAASVPDSGQPIGLHFFEGLDGVL